MFVSSYAPWGAEGIIVRVEADIRRGIPGVDISGLADAAVREARERVRAAFRNSGIEFPADRILINLAPAGLRKEGAALDLPIAVAVMAAAGIIPPPDNLMALGELELSGRLRPVRGVLAAAAAGLKEGIRDFLVPEENAREAAILAGDRFYPASTLSEAVHALQVRSVTGVLPKASGLSGEASDGQAGLREGGDFSEVRGQGRYKRVLEIAAAGAHNLFVFGPPGTGKTMLARRLPSIMASLDGGESVEVTKIHSLAGRLRSWAGGLITTPPFRSPHHSASAEGILGGGKYVKPGEISLAHRGVLFLDEAPEFRSTVLQALREPLEDRVVTIVRAEGPVALPADFQLILAANTCPCGRLGMGTADDGQGCFCSPDEVRRYWRKIGAALLDRIELRVAAKAPGLEALAGESEERSAAVRERVERAVAIQRERFRGSAVRRNARMTPDFIDRFCVLAPGAKASLESVSAALRLSGRSYHGVLRTARTIADLDGRESIASEHILEAAEHRRMGDDPYDIFEIE